MARPLDDWGDFNAIRFIHEKNVTSRVTRNMQDFGSFVNECALQDSPLLNAKFTWTNGCDPPTLCKLDRFLVSNDWEDLYPRFFQEGISKIASDHWPIMLNTSKLNWGPSPFRFENMWTLHHSFHDNVKRWSDTDVDGDWERFQFMKKLQEIKKNLKVWNQNTFGRL